MNPTPDGRHTLKPLDDPWDAGTFEGAEYENMRRAAGFTFEERLKRIEGLFSVVRRAQQLRPEPEPPSDPAGDPRSS